MGTYLLKGVHIDPKTRKRTQPGESIELDDAEAHRLRHMLADPSEAEADDGNEGEKPARRGRAAAKDDRDS